jgi:hypothetical protein
MAGMQKTQERFSAKAKDATLLCFIFQTLKVFEKCRHINRPLGGALRKTGWNAAQIFAPAKSAFQPSMAVVLQEQKSACAGQKPLN